MGHHLSQATGVISIRPHAATKLSLITTKVYAVYKEQRIRYVPQQLLHVEDGTVSNVPL